MSLTISSSNVFYVNLKDSEGLEIENGVNSLAKGLTAVHSEVQGERWGYVNWFDQLNQYMRSIKIKREPIVNGKNYIVTDLNNCSLTFNFVDKNLYNTVIQPLFNHESPELKTDEEVQEYLANLYA